METSAEQQKSQSSSISTFISSAIFNSALTVGVYIVFELLRKKNKKIYEPRTYLLPEGKRTPVTSGGPFKWISSINSLVDDEIIQRIGLDSYMFIRFQRLFMIVFAIFTVLGLAIILPVNYYNQLDLGGLEQFTIGNIDDTNRLWAHTIMAYVFTGIVVFMLHHELYYYIRLRHKYISSPGHRKSPKATTILVTGIPTKLNNEQSLRSLFGIFPGGVKNVWINRDPGKLIKKTDERADMVAKYEGAATQLIIDHAKQYEETTSNTNDDNTEKTRPMHRKIPLVGKKVDSLNIFHLKLLKLNQNISDLQKNIQTFKKYNSAFVQFNNYIGAQLAASSVLPNHLNDIAPKDVIWDNLNSTKQQRMIRKTISISVVVALVLLWSIPVTFMAAISKLEKLTEILPFLKPVIGILPTSIIGLIQGILPAVGLAILMMLLPIILRALSKFEGTTTRSKVEIGVQQKYFFFLVVNVLLVTALANGIFAALPLLLDNPLKNMVDALAQNLPSASTFFLTYVLLSLFGSAMELLQIGPLIVYLLFKRFLAKTPRKVYHLEKNMKYVEWGTRFPVHVLMASIGIVYSTIQPLILPIVCLHFTFYYLAYKYNFLYVYKQPYKSGGLFFPQAVYQVFTGLYIFQLVMLGLMLLKQAFYPTILGIILFGATVVVLLWMKQMLQNNPKVEFLPVDLKGIVDIDSGKLIINQTFGDDADENGGGTHSPITAKEAPVDNGEDDEDDYDDEVVADLDDSLNIGDKVTVPMTYLHPSVKSIQPIIWLPKDDHGTSDKEVVECLKDGIDATNQGASINDKFKVVIDDINQIPKGTRIVTDGSVANNLTLVL